MEEEKIKRDTDEKLRIGEDGFGAALWSKFLFTLISVKVWGLIACTWVSTYLITHNPFCGNPDIGLITGGQWVTFNTTVWALIFGMKEIFRISETKDKNEKAVVKDQLEAKKKIAEINTITDITKMDALMNPEPEKPKFTSDGMEIVGDEPEA